MLNKVVLQGRFTADPEMKTTQSGVSCCNFTVAWSEKYKEIETNCFLSCRAWRQTAEFVPKYFHKGDQVVVEGRLVTQKWQDQQGQNHSMTLCEVDKVHFCGSKNSQGTQNTQGTQNAPQNGFVTDYSGIQGGYMPTSFQNAPQGAGTQNVGTYSPTPQNAAVGASGGSGVVAPPFEVVTDETALPF